MIFVESRGLLSLYSFERIYLAPQEDWVQITLSEFNDMEYRESIFDRDWDGESVTRRLAPCGEGVYENIAYYGLSMPSPIGFVSFRIPVIRVERVYQYVEVVNGELTARLIDEYHGEITLRYSPITNVMRRYNADGKLESFLITAIQVNLFGGRVFSD